MPLDQRIAGARNAGFDGLEIAAGRDIQMDISKDDLARLADTAARHKVEIVCLWASAAFEKTPLNSPDAEVRALGIQGLKRTIEIARALKCGALLLVPGRVDPARYKAGYEDTWKRISAELPKAIPAAQSARVILCMENVWNKFLVSPLEMRAFVDQFHSPWLAVQFDIGNVMQFGFPQDWIRTLGPRIRRVHLKDFKLARGSESGRFVNLLEGDVDWKDVMAALREVGYRGYLSPEISNNAADPDWLTTLSRITDKIIAM
jgi:hexulose-6-phosphate isomerase